MSDSDSEDENGLLNAAATWAEEASKPSSAKLKNRKKSEAASDRNLQPSKSEKDSPVQPLSLHITQLDFDVGEMDLRTHFVTAGCTLSSVRLVYDRGLNGKKLFRGVAFIDLPDKSSYQTALSLHQSELLGRKMNVRPTRTKKELANIVEKTREIVKVKIKKSLEEKDELDASEEGDTQGKKRRRRHHDDDNKGRDRNRDRGKAEHKATEKGPKTDKSPRPPTKDSNSDRKLTKKERNKKAAILMKKRRR